MNMEREFQMVNFRKIDLIGLEIKLTRSQDKNYILIRDLWKKFNPELKNIKNRRSGNWEKFGITYKKDGDIFYVASIEKTDKMILPSDMINKEIKQGQYVCFTHIGAMDAIKTTLFDIFKKIVPKLKLEIKPNEKSGLICFERYDYRFNWNNPNSLLEIYLPLETKQHTMTELTKINN